jgi:RNA polymerase sigma factor (sigma-70 family)
MRDGDRTFEEAFPQAVRLAERIVGDRSAAEDIAAEAITRAWSRRDQIADYRIGWILRVATNLAIDATRRREAPAELPDAASLSNIADEVTLRLVLMDALVALPPRQREAVALRFLGGLSQTQTATALGISTGAVAQHVHRGLASLRKRLGDQMKINSLREALSLVGTKTIVEGEVKDRLVGPLWNIDIGIPAVLVSHGERDPSGIVECVIADADTESRRVVTVPPGAHETDPVIAALQVGERRSGRVHALVPFGAFIDIDGTYGLVHKSRLGDAELHVDEPVDVEILAVRSDLKAVTLGLTKPRTAQTS